MLNWMITVFYKWDCHKVVLLVLVHLLYLLYRNLVHHLLYLLYLNLINYLLYLLYLLFLFLRLVKLARHRRFNLMILPNVRQMMHGMVIRDKKIRSLSIFMGIKFNQDSACIILWLECQKITCFMYLNGESIAKITINNISITAGNLKPRRVICACQKLE